MFFYLFFIFYFLTKQPKKIKQPKTKRKHVHKQLKELYQGQVSDTHLSKSFLTLASLSSPIKHMSLAL